jgi:hypothetical protein
MNNMGKVCEKIRQGLLVEVGALYAVTFYLKVAGLVMVVYPDGVYRN